MISNLRLKAEKKIASRAVASDLGKKVLKELAAPETFVILSSVQELSTRDPSIKPSINIENTILRIASKAHRRPPPPYPLPLHIHLHHLPHLHLHRPLRRWRCSSSTAASR